MSLQEHSPAEAASAAPAKAAATGRGGIPKAQPKAKEGGKRLDTETKRGKDLAKAKEAKKGRGGAAKDGKKGPDVAGKDSKQETKTEAKREEPP